MHQTSKPFTLHVADAAITDLRARLTRTRYPDEPPLPAWSTGTTVAYLESLIDYWQSGFDWRAWEAKLNAFPQFTLPVHGIDVHFIHALSRKPGAPALLLSHGWPGSVSEFHKIIPLLTEHFTVVVPSRIDGNNLVQGPDVVLAAEATQPLAMVLHELTTNAAKRGALSSRGGQVSVCWERQSSCTSQGGLALEWRETGGPPILVPGPSGYGASVIRDLIPYELDGFVDYVLAPEGVRCRFEIPEKWLCSSVLR